MADEVTTDIIVDGSKNTVIKLTNVSDGTGEAAVVKVDVSALEGAPSSVKIMKVIYSCSDMSVNLLWDATANVLALTLPQGSDTLDFSEGGAILNNAGAGVTGDILLTTVGAAAGDTYSIMLYLKKS
jgi:hypothetical protein